NGPLPSHPQKVQGPAWGSPRDHREMSRRDCAVERPNVSSRVLFALFPCICRARGMDRIRHGTYPNPIPRPVRRSTGMSISRVNPSTLIGALAGFLMLATVLAVSASDPGMYVNLPGLAIVLGGTLAAVFISYPLREVLRVFAL